MSNFSFPDHCSYCTKEFNTKHCLFPYALVVALPLPEGNKDKAEYLTKFHRFLRNQITATVPSQLTIENLARHEAQTAASARLEVLTKMSAVRHLLLGVITFFVLTNAA
jgi:hypothetical protein